MLLIRKELEVNNIAGLYMIEALKLISLGPLRVTLQLDFLSK